MEQGGTFLYHLVCTGWGATGFYFFWQVSMLAINRRVYRLVDVVALPTALADFYQQYLASCKPDSNIRLDRGMIYPCPV
jgi:hypothetical protein